MSALQRTIHREGIRAFVERWTSDDGRPSFEAQ